MKVIKNQNPQKQIQKQVQKQKDIIIISNPNPTRAEQLFSNRSIAIVKQSQNIPMDANKLAEYQQLKLNQENQTKKNKIQSFMNSTRINASKIQKEKLQTSMESQNSKKVLLQKQKNIKAKYTVLTNKKQDQEKMKRIKVQPIKVDWKRADDAKQKLKIIQYKQQLEDNSSDQEAIDSQFQGEKITSPQELISFRENIRKAMLMKGNK